jgi:hypothetical protein
MSKSNSPSLYIPDPVTMISLLRHPFLNTSSLLPLTMKFTPGLQIGALLATIATSTVLAKAKMLSI